MVVLSRFPIDVPAVRTFRKLRWSAMSDAAMPAGFWPDDVATALRLSSKSHQDVPIRLPDGRTLHVLVSHPTPPVFDGPEDRNGRRNHDEIRFWIDYVAGADWIVADDGTRGGLAPDALFVVAGDLNADPEDGDSFDDPIGALLAAPRVAGEPAPTSAGAAAAGETQGGANVTHRGPHATDTADFADTPGPGNLRADYVLPCRDLEVVASGVFWPRPHEPGHDWLQASDHRLVWIDLR